MCGADQAFNMPSSQKATSEDDGDETRNVAFTPTKNRANRLAKEAADADSPSKRAKSLASPSSKIEELVEKKLSEESEKNDSDGSGSGSDEEDDDDDDVVEETEEEIKAAKEKRKKQAKAERAKRKAKYEHDKKVRRAHLRHEQKVHAERRRRFLEKQNEIFKHFMKSSSSLNAPGSAKGPKKSKKRMAEEEEDQEILKETMQSSSGKGSMAEDVVFQESPSFIKGGTMRHYQVEGLNWLVQLQANGINGILADEMGLGKTLQSISILGYMHDVKNVTGPHIVVVPKSVIGNWMNELAKWCPQIKAFKYHGNKQQRQEMNATVMRYECVFCKFDENWQV